MKVINNIDLTNSLVDHPYDSNPDYFAKVNIYYISQDKKFVAGYWEAPVGWFEAEIKGFNEINYVVEGEIEFVTENRSFTAKAGDCFLVENGDRMKWQIKQALKTYFFIYPATKDLMNELKKMMI